MLRSDHEQRGRGFEIVTVSPMSNCIRAELRAGNTTESFKSFFPAEMLSVGDVYFISLFLVTSRAKFTLDSLFDGLQQAVRVK